MKKFTVKPKNKITASCGLSMYRSHSNHPEWKTFRTIDDAYDYVDKLGPAASDYEEIYIITRCAGGLLQEDVYRDGKWYRGRPTPAKSDYTYDTFLELVSQYEFDYANGRSARQIWDAIFDQTQNEDLANDVVAELEDSVDVVDRNPMFSSKRIRRGRYIKSNTFTYPQYIEVERNPNIWVKYKKLYEHEGGGCYYTTSDDYSPVTSFISLYPDGHLTYLWNGVEKAWSKNWR